MAKRTFEIKGPSAEIAISVTLEEDVLTKWELDEEDPVDLGYVRYDVTVRAIKVVDGYMEVGEAHMYDYYHSPSAPIGDLDGFLPHLIKQAVAYIPT